MPKMYWWNEPDKPNFGDRLNWTILDKLGHAPTWTEPLKADLVLMGSILEHLPPVWSGTVCGAGKMFAESTVDLSRARVLAVRGHLTARSIRHYSRDIVFGDPALMLPLWFRQRPAIHELGIVPHWTDTELWSRFKYGHLIDPTAHPEQVVQDITSCRRIISSSLHGLIIADAFGIPRRAELFPRAITHAHHEGGDFKFRDYASVFDGDPHFGEFWTAPYDRVQELRNGLRPALAKAVGEWVSSVAS
jgi:pyruvyltransferase